MTPIEELRKGLDELGVKYTTDNSNDYEVIEWGGSHNLWWQFVYDPYEELPYGELRLLDGGGATSLTPEQAIDVTVSTEPDEATMLKLHDRMNATLLDYESAMGIDGGNGANAVPFVNEMHQIIEDAAKVGVGTCHCTTPDDAWCFSCSSCGKSFPRNELHIAHNHGEINYCPNCGRRIVG
jgi:DNA-directed RNA polymerase subunit RPC12/RpoP